MKHLRKIMPKKSPKPPNIAAGPSGFVSALAAPQDENGGTGSFQQCHPMDEDPELITSEGLISDTLIESPGHIHDVNPSSETGGREIESTEAPSSAKRAREGTLLGDASEATEKFGPLKFVLGSIPALFANREGTIAAGEKIGNLLPRVAALEEHFDSRPADVAEMRGRDELIRKFKGIETQLRSLSEKPEWQQLTDHARDNEDVLGLLDDLQEAIVGYQMERRATASDVQGFKSIGPAEATVLNNIRYAQQAEYRHGNRNGCLKGTRRAILDEIELWTHDFGKPSVYWLNGLAGTGKTTIAQTGGSVPPSSAPGTSRTGETPNSSFLQSGFNSHAHTQNFGRYSSRWSN
ncbi:hypothetical protein BJ322DRAFT_789980 [Thelephora terrestris]|uniref:Uncharacterized protein n=1 Tax=Thelephora terrestris TaxID=56493 RepID=A0A9P6HJA1_9AGAM|nr:hypothetical protein BJ322DRAFT_789980 [Thelephora terrestris]